MDVLNFKKVPFNSILARRTHYVSIFGARMRPLRGMVFIRLEISHLDGVV